MSTAGTIMLQLIFYGIVCELIMCGAAFEHAALASESNQPNHPEDIAQPESNQPEIIKPESILDVKSQYLESLVSTELGPGDHLITELTIPGIQLSDENKALLAETFIGLMHLRGLGGVPQDNVQAYIQFRSAAEKGNSYAQALTGSMFLDGKGVEKDLDKAYYYFTLSAEQGHPEGYNGLGLMYLEGNGVNKDENKAFHYFQLSADHRNGDGLAQLGYLYVHGLGVEKNLEKGIAFMKESAELGCPKGANYLFKIKEIMDEIIKDLPEETP